jgi:transcriptional regulator with XRE-family HTH domain
MYGGGLTVRANGARFRALREERSRAAGRELRQYEVEREAGVGAGQLTRYERGLTINLNDLERMANYYGVTPRDLTDPSSLSVMLGIRARIDELFSGGMLLPTAPAPQEART